MPLSYKSSLNNRTLSIYVTEFPYETKPSVLASALWHMHIIFYKSVTFDEKKGIQILNEYFLMKDLTNLVKLCSCVNILKMFWNISVSNYSKEQRKIS